MNAQTRCAHQRALFLARQIYPACGNWRQFRNALYGLQGLFRDLFRDEPSRKAWLASQEAKEVNRMIERLREPKPTQPC